MHAPGRQAARLDQSPDARKVLEALAAGEVDSIQTREAKVALNRPVRRTMASEGR